EPDHRTLEPTAGRGVRAVIPDTNAIDQRHREPQRPVPPGGPTSRSLPQRASRHEDPLPRRPSTAVRSVEPDRQDQRLETHPERTHHPLRRPHHQHQPLMTITTAYTKNRTVTRPVAIRRGGALPLVCGRRGIRV